MCGLHALNGATTMKATSPVPSGNVILEFLRGLTDGREVMAQLILDQLASTVFIGTQSVGFPSGEGHNGKKEIAR